MHSYTFMTASTGQDKERKYIPGSCNIGEVEIRRRYRIGFIGIALTFLLMIIIELTNAINGWRLLVFFPLFYGLSGFIQAWKKFCYVYGFRSLMSMRGRKKFERNNNPRFSQMDRSTAYLIVATVTLGSIILTGLYYVAGLR